MILVSFCRVCCWIRIFLWNIFHEEMLIVRGKAFCGRNFQSVDSNGIDNLCEGYN